MNIQSKLSFLLISILVCTNILAQEMSLVYDVENTGINCPVPYLPSFADLPFVTPLPDPFLWSDGRGQIANFSDWRYRRAEIVTEVQHYELGEKPAPPDSIKTSFANNAITMVIYDNETTLTMTAVIQYPSTGTAPYPAVIGVGGGSGSLPSNLFLDRGVATIAYNFSEVAPWTQNGRGLGEFYKMFPNTKVGYLTAWSWGISRIIDGLELVPEANIDVSHLAVTGCSFAGKIALYSGAFDERIALTIAQEPGGGGDAAWRVTESLDGSRETLSNAQSYGWYHEDVKQFNNAVSKLPFDHHEVMAMVAPRALLVLGNPDYEWLADESGYVACLAARDVWTSLGVSDRFGFSKVGGHGHCSLPAVQYPEVGAFIDKFLVGNQNADTDIAIHPDYSFMSLSQWIKWTIPTLQNGTSYFKKTSLVSPPNNETNTDTSVSLIWNSSDEVDKYIVELSTTSAFTSNTTIDSTSDTTITISDLEKGRKYYWHVQVKSISGSYGPFSDFQNFTTFIPLPEKPQPISAISYSTRADYIKLNWHNVEYADKYLVQISKYEDFRNTLKSSFATDTTVTLSGTSEGVEYFWRVQAKNISGDGEWSTIEKFTIILPPSNLSVENGGAHAIILDWKDNSDVEEGFIVQRCQAPDTVFSVIDTVAANVTEYFDAPLLQSTNYTYRLAAFLGSAISTNSNEESMELVEVDEQSDLPMEYSISQNFPNPFNPTTKINFSLPKSSMTSIALYDLQGNKIMDLLDKNMEAGYHEMTLDASGLASGVYIYEIRSGNFTQSKRMVLMK